MKKSETQNISDFKYEDTNKDPDLALRLAIKLGIKELSSILLEQKGISETEWQNKVNQGNQERSK